MHCTVFIKRNAHLIPNFLWTPWGSGAKNLHNQPCEFLAPLPKGGNKKFGINPFTAPFQAVEKAQK